MSKIIKIALWSGPRNISTALMYSFANRNDVKVIDEPLFGYFLNYSGAWRPSRKEVLATMELIPENIIEQIVNPTINKPVFFIKNMANHLIDLNWSFLDNFYNIILTRDPKDMLMSYSKHIGNPTMLDTCYEIQVELIEYLTNKAIPFVVVDSKEILQNPEKALKRICSLASIPFSVEMLNWEKGPLKEDGIWAKYWYNNVHSSNSFGNYVSNDQKLPIQITDIYEKCLIHYNQILKFQT